VFGGTLNLVLSIYLYLFFHEYTFVSRLNLKLCAFSMIFRAAVKEKVSGYRYVNMPPTGCDGERM